MASANTVLITMMVIVVCLLFSMIDHKITIAMPSERFTFHNSSLSSTNIVGPIHQKVATKIDNQSGRSSHLFKALSNKTLADWITRKSGPSTSRNRVRRQEEYDYYEDYEETDVGGEGEETPPDEADDGNVIVLNVLSRNKLYELYESLYLCVERHNYTCE